MPDTYADSAAAIENQHLWETLEFSLTQLAQPTVVWVTTYTKLDMRLQYAEFRSKFWRKNHHVLDLSTQTVTSLSNELQQRLPSKLQVRNESPIEHFVHIFGLENSVSPLGQVPLLYAFNHEREMLFRGFHCVLVIWSEPAFRERAREAAADFWDWLELDLVFQTDRPLRNTQSLGWTWQWEWNPYRSAHESLLKKDTFQKAIITGLIAYAEADTQSKRELEEKLFKNADESVVWKFAKLESLGSEKGDTFTDSLTKHGDFLVYLLSPKFLEIWAELSKQGRFLNTHAVAYDWLQLRGMGSTRKEELFQMFWTLKNQKQHAPLLILLEPCDWQHGEFAHSPVLPENGKPLSEILIQRKEDKVMNELALSLASKAEQVRYYYQRTAYREYGSVWFNPEKFDTKSRANRLVFWAVLGVLCILGQAEYWLWALVFVLIYRQLLLAAVLVSVYRALNWHPQLWSPHLLAKIVTTPHSLKYLLIKDGFTPTFFPADQNWKITQALTLENTDRFSWPETLGIFSVAIFRAAAWASLFVAIFHWKDWVWWASFLAALLLHLVGRQVLGHFVLKKTAIADWKAR
jgi:hypothetical protein